MDKNCSAQKVRKNHIISEDITCQRLKKLAASLAIAAMAAGCGIIEHQPYPYKTSTKNPALGAWELVQTRMNSKFMPLYRVKTEEPNNILFVGKKQACHLSLYQIDGQKPDRQRQVGALEHRTGNQRSLVSAGAALKGLARATLEDAMFGVAVARALKAIGPSGGFQCGGALPFGTETLHELGERQSLLELNAIHRHGTPLNSEISVHYAPLKKATPNIAEESY